MSLDKNNLVIQVVKDKLGYMWKIQGIENHLKNMVKIFDRWENIVWEMSNYDNKQKVWRGIDTYNFFSKDIPIPEGTYFITAELNNGTILYSTTFNFNWKMISNK